MTIQEGLAFLAAVGLAVLHVAVKPLNLRMAASYIVAGRVG